MKLNEKDRCEINRIIGEALGWKSVPPSGSIYDPDGKHTSLVDFPDFCGNNTEATKAMLLLSTKMGVDITINISAAGEVSIYVWEPLSNKRLAVSYDGLKKKEGDRSIAAALVAAMFKWEYKTDSTEKEWCFKPALEAVLKQKGGESNGK